MALQMGVALSAAFAIGLLFFPQHWGWSVLTAFIVCSGARGRGDAAYKGSCASAARWRARSLRRLCSTSRFRTAWRRPSQSSPRSFSACGFASATTRTGRRASRWCSRCFSVRRPNPASRCSSGGSKGFSSARCAPSQRRGSSIRFERNRSCGGAWPTSSPRSKIFSRATRLRRNERRLAVVEHRAAEMDRVAPPVELHRRIFARSVDEHPAAWIAIVRELLAHARERVGRRPARR